MIMDVFFLHTDEPNSNENFARLLAKAPNAISVKAPGNIFESHKHLASMSTNDKFYVVDGDCWIVDRFKFEDHNIDLPQKSVAVFRAKNPVNGLVYGHGGIKLFSKDCFSAERLDRPDMTTTLADAYIKVDVLASEHRFNYSPYATWRTGFREAVKLSAGLNKNNNDKESLARLDMWCQCGIESFNGYFAIQGARQGVTYARDEDADFSLVNDFSWLRAVFNNWIGN